MTTKTSGSGVLATTAAKHLESKVRFQMFGCLMQRSAVLSRISGQNRRSLQEFRITLNEPLLLT